MKQILILAAVGLLVIGAYLWLTWPADAPPAPTSQGPMPTMPPIPFVAAPPPTLPEPVILPPTTTEPPPPPEEMAILNDPSGVQVLGVTVNGTTVNVRFMVLFPEKAAPLLTPGGARYLVAQKSGDKLLPGGRRATGVRPASNDRRQRTYIATFDNSAGQVSAGDKVALVTEQFSLPDLTVE